MGKPNFRNRTRRQKRFATATCGANFQEIPPGSYDDRPDASSWYN